MTTLGSQVDVVDVAVVVFFCFHNYHSRYQTFLFSTLHCWGTVVAESSWRQDEAWSVVQSQLR